MQVSAGDTLPTLAGVSGLANPELLYGTTDPQTRNRLDINTSSEGIVTYIMDQSSKKRQRNPMSERER